MADNQVTVVGPLGETKQVSTSELRNLGKDWRTESRTETATRERAIKHSNVGSAVAAGALGALRGVTIGGSDYLARGTELGEYADEVKQEHELFSAGGEAIGALLPALATGGSSAGARALAMTPAGLLARAGTAVAGETGSLLRLGAAAALEGGVYGAGMAVSESSLANRELSAEAIAQGALGGAVTGGVMGMGIGAGFKGLAMGATKARGLLQRAASRAEEVGGGNLVSAMAINTGRSQAEVEAALARANIKATGGLDDAQRAADAVRGSAKATNRAAYEADIAQDLANMGYAKKGNVERLVARDNAEMQYHAMRGAIDDAKSRFSQALEVGEASFDKIKKIKRAVNELEEHARVLDRAYKAGDSAEMMMIGDRAKRLVQKEAYGAGMGGGRSSSQRLNNTHKVFNETSKNMRAVLTDEGLWGNAGAYQRQLNQEWTTKITLEQETGIRNLLGKRIGGGKSRTWRWKEDQAGKALDKALSKDGGQLRDDLIRYYKQQSAMADIRLTSEFSDAAEKAHAQVSKTAADDFIRDLENMRTANDALDAAKSVKQDASLAKTIGGAIATAAGSGMLGGTAAAVVHLAQKPIGIMQRLMSVESMTGGLAKTLSSKSVKLFGERVALQSKSTGRLPVVANSARKVASSKERYVKAKQDLEMAANSRDQVAQQVARALAPLASQAPELAQMAMQKEMAKIDYLQANLPTSELPRTPFELPPVASKVEMSAFLRRLDIVEDPLKALDLLESGKLTHEHVDALKTVYPAIYGQMQEQVMTGLTKAQSDGQTVPYRKRLQMGILLDLPVDATMSPEIINTMQGMYGQERTPEQASQAGSKQGPRADLSSAYETDTEKLAREA